MCAPLAPRRKPGWPLILQQICHAWAPKFKVFSASAGNSVLSGCRTVPSDRLIFWPF
jgi:hypothetical protein